MNPSRQAAIYRSLNRQQLEAVTYDGGHLLVIAGAGSGKTRTLTCRVAHLVEKGVSPESILLLTFTRKAAQEMLLRASSLLDHRCRHVIGGTFHSFAFSQLKQYAHNIGLYNYFSVLDRSDTEDLIEMARKALPPDGFKEKAPYKATLASIFSRTVNMGRPLEEVVYEYFPHFGVHLEQIHKIWEAYGRTKRVHHYVDFDDLLIYLRQLLSEDDGSREALRRQFRYILVDEYQDTNTIQADILSLLTGSEQRLMAVGDDAQSIYAFRGADPENMLIFPLRFPGTHIVKLEQNYRSAHPILALTNAIINQAAHVHEKHLFTRRTGGDTPCMAAAADEHTQSRYVAGEIARWYSRGLSYQDIAVLFRAGYLSFDLELELTRRGIPFQKFGGFRFTASAHIKDMLAHFKILLWPLDRISWYRILKLIPSIGGKTAQAIFEAIQRQGRGAEGLLSFSSDAFKMAALESLKALIDDLATHTSSLSLLGEKVLAYYRPLLESRYDDYPRRLRDLQQLLNIMDRYDSLDRFMADMLLEPPDTSINGQLFGQDDNRDRLTLSTIHSAKGLEWRVVFIIWALDGRFPSHRAFGREADLEEERRLMYVAATRAKDALVITYPTQIYDRATESLLYEPSRFLEGIDEGLIQRCFFKAGDV